MVFRKMQSTSVVKPYLSSGWKLGFYNCVKSRILLSNLLHTSCQPPPPSPSPLQQHNIYMCVPLPLHLHLPVDSSFNDWWSFFLQEGKQSAVSWELSPWTEHWNSYKLKILFYLQYAASITLPGSQRFSFRDETRERKKWWEKTQSIPQGSSNQEAGSDLDPRSNLLVR